MARSDHRIGVWMPSWVGDSCMATPAIRALRESFASNVQLFGIMKPVVRDLLAGSNWFDQIIAFEKQPAHRGAGKRKLIAALRSARLDTLLLFPNSLWTAMASRLAGVRRIVGYRRDGRGWLLTDSLEAPRENRNWRPIPAIDYYLRLAHHLGCESKNRETQLAVTEQECQIADDLWTALQFNPHQSTVVINSSGASSPSRLWPASHVEQLARRIVEHHPWQVLIHCGPAEQDSAEEIVERIDHPRVRSMGAAHSLPIGLSKGVIARSSVVVSTDSGPRHMAVALAPHVISLLGPTSLSWTETYNSNESPIQVELDCRPCWKSTCPLGHNACMRNIVVDTVYAKIVEVVGRRMQVQRSPIISAHWSSALCAPSSRMI